MFLNTKINPEELSPLVLAYIGDAVYELYVRVLMVERKGMSGVKDLHTETVELVKASYQSDFFHEIENSLASEELKIFKKGRNSKSPVPKSTAVSDYRCSTGLEALLGFLYLKRDEKRLLEILTKLEEYKENRR